MKLPETLTEMGEKVFCDCSRLEACYIPDNLEDIESGAFHRCEKLKYLIIPENTHLSVDAFDDMGVNFFVVTQNKFAMINCNYMKIPTTPFLPPDAEE